MSTLPITVTVAPTGAVTIEAGSRIIAMNRFSERAGRLARDFGPGVHVFADLDGMANEGARDDIADALA